jgi:hypothetical protein
LALSGTDPTARTVRDARAAWDAEYRALERAAVTATALLLAWVLWERARRRLWRGDRSGEERAVESALRKLRAELSFGPVR